MDRTDSSRRQFLRAALPASVLALAGCPSGSSDTPAGTDSTSAATPTDAPTRTATATDTETPTATAEGTTAQSDDPVAWIESAAVPLETTDPSASLDDLSPLEDAFGDVRIVGMGEATHGTREFFQLKHRLLRFMVEELDYRLFAWEANFSETLLIDEYVTGGDVNPVRALDNIYFWTWDTAESLAMLEWIREFNEGRDPDDQVRFYGFDTQYVRGPADRLRSYLSEVDPDYLAEVEADLDPLAEEGAQVQGQEARLERLETAQRLADEIGERLSSHEESYVEASSREAWELADRHRWTMDRAAGVLRSAYGEEDVDAPSRDESMADNVSWILDHEDHDQIALWAHNGHVRNDTVYGEVTAMGSYLREEFGDDYYPLGFEFGRGSFRSISRETQELREFTLEEPQADTLPETLTAVDSPLFALDFDSVEDERLREWLSQPRYMHGIGALFTTEEGWQWYHRQLNVTEAYDGLLFVEETAAARPIPEEREVTPTVAQTDSGTATATPTGADTGTATDTAGTTPLPTETQTDE